MKLVNGQKILWIKFLTISSFKFTRAVDGDIKVDQDEVERVGKEITCTAAESL